MIGTILFSIPRHGHCHSYDWMHIPESGFFFISVVLVEDDQGSNHTGNPAGAGKKQDDKDRAAAFVYDSERRKND